MLQPGDLSLLSLRVLIYATAGRAPDSFQMASPAKVGSTHTLHLGPE